MFYIYTIWRMFEGELTAVTSGSTATPRTTEEWKRFIGHMRPGSYALVHRIDGATGESVKVIKIDAPLEARKQSSIS
jgi:hypothetical protein